MPSIPKSNRDLRRLSVKRTVLRVLGFLLWVALWYSGAVIYNQNHMTYPPERRMVSWRLAAWMGIAVLSGILLFRMWRLITDRKVSGVIESSGLSHRYTAAEDGTLLQATNFDFRLHTAITVRSSNGKLHRLRFEQKNGFYMYYHEGNRIVRFRGLPYPVNTDPEAKHGYVCSVCGFWCKTHVAQCPACYHSLIAPEEIEQNEP